MPNVTVVCHDSPTRDTCPTLYRTDDGEYYVQGYEVTDAEVLAQIPIPAGERVVRVTLGLLRLIIESGLSDGPIQLRGPAAAQGSVQPA